MSKLDTMKATMTEYDRATKVYEELPPGFWDAKATGEVIRARNRLVASAPDSLRTLLAVAEAAAEYKRDGGYEPMAKLFDALKALE